MGTDIGSIVKKKEISLDYLNGRTIGVDSFNILYQFLSSIRGRDGTPLMDSTGRITSHLTGLLYRTTNLIEKGIKPVFVFDGTPPELKTKTRADRRKIRTDAEKKFKQAKEEGKEKEMAKYARQAVSLKTEMIEEAKELIKLMGLPVVQAEGDGEAQVAQMAEKEELFGCISQDFDSLLFGAPNLLRNITVSGKRKLPGKDIYIEVKPEEILLNENLKMLGINRQKLVWIGILVGTDFNEKFPGIGAKTALKLVQEHNSFEDIISKTKFKPDFDFKEIEDIFLKPAYSKNYKIEFKKPNKEKILEFLCEQRGFSKERVQNAVNKLIMKSEEKGIQSRLGAWS